MRFEDFPNYKYSEDVILREIKDYVDATYGEHYAQDKIQATEFIIDAGHAKGLPSATL
jgi:hypothetical protein